MVMSQLWTDILNEVIGAIAVAGVVAFLTYAYRMWQLPKLQADTITELRELRNAIAQLSEQMRKTCGFRTGDLNDAVFNRHNP